MVACDSLGKTVPVAAPALKRVLRLFVRRSTNSLNCFLETCVDAQNAGYFDRAARPHCTPKSGGRGPATGGDALLSRAQQVRWRRPKSTWMTLDSPACEHSAPGESAGVAWGSASLEAGAAGLAVGAVEAVGTVVLGGSGDADSEAAPCMNSTTSVALTFT